MIYIFSAFSTLDNKTSGTAMLTPININTNPFLTNKLHQSSSNLCGPSAIGCDNQLNNNKLNRFSLDLSCNNLPFISHKEWTPFDDFHEFEETSRRKVSDDTIKTAHLEGKRVCNLYILNFLLFSLIIFVKF